MHSRISGLMSRPRVEVHSIPAFDGKAIADGPSVLASYAAGGASNRRTRERPHDQNSRPLFDGRVRRAHYVQVPGIRSAASASREVVLGQTELHRLAGLPPF